MNIRLFIVGFIWLGVMLLLFTSPVTDSHPIYFELIPARSLVHGLLFWGFVHIWIGTCKKQLKYESVRRKAFRIVFISALALAVISETIMYLIHPQPSLIGWNLLFDLVGASLGLLSFRILYARCY